MGFEIEIDDDLALAAIKATGAASLAEAIEIAVKELVDRAERSPDHAMNRTAPAATPM